VLQRFPCHPRNGTPLTRHGSLHLAQVLLRAIIPTSFLVYLPCLFLISSLSNLNWNSSYPTLRTIRPINPLTYTWPDSSHACSSSYVKAPRAHTEALGNMATRLLSPYNGNHCFCRQPAIAQSSLAHTMHILSPIWNSIWNFDWEYQHSPIRLLWPLLVSIGSLQLRSMI